MATSDVPGANPRHGDTLHKDCWAESAKDDGSYVKVDSVENGRVIYSIFDTSRQPPVEFRDAMSEAAFKKQFSWDDTNKDSVRWTWHDRSDFPWDVVIKRGSAAGQRTAMAADTIAEAGAIADVLRDRVAGHDDTVETDALRVARDLGLQAQDLSVDSPAIQRAATEIARGFQRALRELRR